MPSKKHRNWHRELAAYWKANPITHCELRFADCWGTYGLAPAHSKDRRDIHTQADFNEVLAACQKCHFTADREMSKEDRLQLFKNIIASRDTTVSA